MSAKKPIFHIARRSSRSFAASSSVPGFERSWTRIASSSTLRLPRNWTRSIGLPCHATPPLGCGVGCCGAGLARRAAVAGRRGRHGAATQIGAGAYRGARLACLRARSLRALRARACGPARPRASGGAASGSAAARRRGRERERRHPPVPSQTIALDKSNIWGGPRHLRLPARGGLAQCCRLTVPRGIYIKVER